MIWATWQATALAVRSLRVPSTTGWTSLAPSHSGTNAVFASSTPYTLSLSLTNTGSGYTFTSILNGGGISDYTLTKTDSTNASLASFNEFVLYVNGGTSALNSLNITSMTTAVIPEPATYGAILGALVLGVVAFRRFRA